MASNSRRFPTAQSPRRVAVNAPRPEADVSQFVFLIDIAAYLGRTSDAVRARVQRLKCQTVLVRRDVSGQSALAVSAEDAKRIIASDIKPASIIKPEDIFK